MAINDNHTTEPTLEDLEKARKMAQEKKLPFDPNYPFFYYALNHGDISIGPERVTFEATVFQYYMSASYQTAKDKERFWNSVASFNSRDRTRARKIAAEQGKHWDENAAKCKLLMEKDSKLFQEKWGQQ